MEKFMYLFRGGDMSSMSPEEQQAQMGKWYAWIEKLRKQGRYLAGEPLTPEGKVVTGAKRAITDGPFSESKEVVGGFFVIEAKDIKEATSLTDGYPDFDFGGSIEVRPVMKLDMP